MRFQVVKLWNIWIVIFCVTMLYSLVNGHEYFGATYRLYFPAKCW
jgi:hypothetical protein